MASLSVISPKFTEETLAQIVERIKPGSRVKCWELDMCSNRGSSYLSEVNRLKITGQLEEEDFHVTSIVKSLPRSLSRRLTFRSAEFFSRETEFYDKIWLGFEDFQRRHKILEPFDELPRCLATFEDGEHDFIAMDDLGIHGFRSADRQVGMDVSHCKLALASLGKFHGLSHAMRSIEPETFDTLASHMVDIYYAEEARDWYTEIAALQIDVARDAVHREYPGSAVEQRMHKFTDNTSDFYSRMIELTHTVNEFAVIGHGDCWLPNFMFNYDDADPANPIPKRMKMIDFQLVRLGSCALDISFFIYSCTTEQLRTEHYEDMIQWYYGGVEHVLKQFSLDHAKVFPMSVLKDELKAFARFGVGMAMESLPLSIMSDDETADMDSIEGSQPLSLPEVWKLKPIASQEGRRRLANVFKHAVEQGLSLNVKWHFPSLSVSPTSTD